MNVEVILSEDGFKKTLLIFKTGILLKYCKFPKETSETLNKCHSKLPWLQAIYLVHLLNGFLKFSVSV